MGEKPEDRLSSWQTWTTVCLKSMVSGFALLAIVLVGISSADVPPVFDDYFDEDVKIVDLSQEVAIKACLSPSTPLLTKISSATKQCLGKDDKFDWADFSKINQGQDLDKNGLTVQLENAEACFYGEMGWLVNNKVVKKDVIIADFKNLDGNIKTDFVEDINQCTSWNGQLSNSRKKREADELNDYYEDESVDVAPELPSLLDWMKSLVRSRRQASAKRMPVKGAKKPVRKLAKPQVKRPVRKLVEPSARKKKIRKLPQKKGLSARSGSKTKRKKIKKKKFLKKKKQRKRIQKNTSRSIDIGTYNKLWCFDLAVGRALKTCVERKLKS